MCACACVCSLDSDEHLRNCIAAARKQSLKETRDVAGSRDPAVDDFGWLAPDTCTPFGLKETTGKYAFQSMAWRRADLRVMHLSCVHRTGDVLLRDALTAIRKGDVHDASVAALVAATARRLPVREDGIEPTTLYPVWVCGCLCVCARALHMCPCTDL